MNHQRIYRYRPDSLDRDLNTLVNGAEWASLLKDLNDPYEFHFNRAGSKLNEAWASCSVVCFSRSATSPLLWSHYADAHKGFAIAYDFSKTGLHWGGSEGGEGDVFGTVYEDHPPRVEDCKTRDDAGTAFARTKPTCWAYEQELRRLHSNTSGQQPMDPAFVKEVLLGANMPPERKIAIRDTLAKSHPKAQVIEMEFIPEAYGVRPARQQRGLLP